MKFIFSHKDIEVPEGYTLIDNRENNELDHRLYSEIAGIDLLAKKLAEAEKAKESDTTGNTNPDFPPVWITTAHYRRTPDPDCCNRTYVAQPIILQTSLAQHYAACHFIEDLELMGKAIKECYPNMVQTAEQILNGNILIPYNIFNMQYGQFKDYSKFVIDILKKTHELAGNHNYEDTLEIMKRREPPKVEGRNNDPVYQTRWLSFLSERVSTIYFLTAARQMPIYPMKIIKTDGAW